MTPTPKSHVFSTVLALILFGVTGWYGFNGYGQLSQAKTDITQTDQALALLEQESQSVTQVYQDAKKTFMDNENVKLEKIETVFPSKEDLTDLTRAFDAFATKNHYSSNPFFVSQLTYGEMTTKDGYQVLPVTMSVECSEKNFYKFLNYIESSGSLDTGVQLMSINALSLQMEEETDTLRVQLSLYAYLQNL
ncbi:MAG: hypothetical protein WC882_00205 [Candidatus Gracilibacteria bacterium]